MNGTWSHRVATAERDPLVGMDLGGTRTRWRDVLALTRPGQWAKNLLVIPIALLDLRGWSASAVARLAWAVAVFTVASALVYLLNDILDRHRDRAHPTKRLRPIAAARVSIRAASVLATVQIGLLAGLLCLQPWQRWWPVASYLALAAAYCLALKHVPLLEAFVVAIGFGLRLALGYVALDIDPSGWMLICVFSLCLLLTFGKRRQELVLTGGAHRPALRGYNLPLIDQLMMLSAVLSVGAYLLYLRTEAPLGEHGLVAAVLSAPLALFGVFRYLQLVLVDNSGDNPARLLLRDPALVANALVWAALSGGLLAAAHPA